MERWVMCACVLFAASSGWAATSAPNEYTAGRESYAAGEMKGAIRHFKNAVAINPDEANYCYWLGRSYATLADIRTPLNHGPVSNARRYLERATVLAPKNTEYRDEFFNFLIETDRSGGALRLAARVLEATPPSDPEYAYMNWRLKNERSALSSPEEWFGTLFQFVPRKLVGIAQMAAPANPTGSK